MTDKKVLSFEEINRIDVSKHIEKKMGLSYLSWAWAHAEMKKIDPDAKIIIHEFPDYIQLGEQVLTVDKPFLKDSGGTWVKVTVVLNEKEETEWLPVMDMRNKAMPNPDAMSINKAHKRCFVKALALHGLGLFIYAGEDLPETEPPKPATDIQKSGLRKLMESLTEHTGRTYQEIEAVVMQKGNVPRKPYEQITNEDYGRMLAYTKGLIEYYDKQKNEQSSMEFTYGGNDK